MITAIDKLQGSGLRVVTEGGRICMDEAETKALCALLPGLFPEHFGIREIELECAVEFNSAEMLQMIEAT